MFGSKKSTYQAKSEIDLNVETIIGQNADFKGTLVSDKSVRIDGNWEGEININGDLVIGKTGSIIGNVFVNNIMISGKMNGDVTAKGKVELLSSGTLIGNIRSATFVVDEGAIFDGSRATLVAQE